MDTLIRPTGSSEPPAENSTTPPSIAPATDAADTAAAATTDSAPATSQPAVIDPATMHVGSDTRSAGQYGGQPVSFGSARKSDELLDWRGILADQRVRKGLKIAGLGAVGIFIILSLIYLV